MYVRGSDQNIEYKRDLSGFFRGIVVDDYDPLNLQRVKIFVPGVTNYDSGRDEDAFKAPHKIGSIKPVDHQKLLDICPYAEQASSLWGELGSSHYSASSGSQVSKATYVDNQTDDKPPNSKTGGLMPRQSISNRDNAGAGSSIDGFSNINPHAASYLPINSGPDASGFYGVPSVGSKVWVFFERGDINLPVYFAGCPNMMETEKVNLNGMSGTPEGFSSNYGQNQIEDRPPEPLQQDNLNRDRVTERTDFGNIDSETRRLLYELTQSEVGGQGRDAQIAFMETVSNRAAAEGRSIYSIVTDIRYYEPLQRGITRPVSSTTRANYDSVFSEVARGSNITKGATHNASAGVARSVRAGGYNSNLSSIIEIGGETFYNKEFPREQNWLKRFNETS